MLRLESNPRWWQLYLKLVPRDNEVHPKYKGQIPPADVSELPPMYYDHVHRVFVLATFPDPRGERSLRLISTFQNLMKKKRVDHR